jgi:hypothetical protein
MRKTRTALQADDRFLHESSFSLSFCLTVLVYQPVRLTALERRYLDDRDESLSGDAEDIYRTDEAILKLFLPFPPCSLLFFNLIYFPRATLVNKIRIVVDGRDNREIHC